MATALQNANVFAQNKLLSAQTDNVKADTLTKLQQPAQIIASAANTSTQTEKLKQEIQAWIDIGRERAMIDRDKAWYEAAIAGSQKNVMGNSEQARTATFLHEAQVLANRAKLLGLEIPQSLAHAAFWNSELAKPKAFADPVIDSASRFITGAGNARRLLQFEKP